MRKYVMMAFFLFAAVTVLWLTGGTVQAHLLGFSSVDGCEIRWQESTQYDSARNAAQNGWEALKGSDNCVDIEPDVWWTVNDLSWFDTNRSDVTWAGQYQYYSGAGVADKIYLNIFYMAGFSSCKKDSVAMHELGHAHGLAHSYDPNVMTTTSYPCVIGSHDSTDYNTLW